jgi:hypothetical protein
MPTTTNFGTQQPTTNSYMKQKVLSTLLAGALTLTSTVDAEEGCIGHDIVTNVSVARRSSEQEIM